MTLKKIRWTLTSKDTITLYKACIMPFIDQGDIFYSCSNEDILKSLQVQQNKALRVIIGSKSWINTLEAHNQTHILTTSNRRNLNLVSYAHKLSHKPETTH